MTQEFFSLIISVSLSLLSVSHTLHQSRIFCNKCGSAGLELRSWWWKGRWASASDPWSAQREARLNLQHLQREREWTRFSIRQYKNDLSFNTYISQMFEHWYVTPPALSLYLSASVFSLPLSPCVSSLGSILLTLSLRSLIDILGEALQRERERNESHTVAADSLPSSTNNGKNITSHPAGICHRSFCLLL